MKRALMLLLALPEARAAAQRDTTALATVVITANRRASTLGSSAAAVTRIESAELARVPHATVADVLRLVPGLAVVDFDGMGNNPQIMARGFYGGGEAEYVVVMVDGIPLDQLHTGLVPWDALPPLSAIEAIEVVRGGTSALYGSSALGGVINVITRRSTSPRWHVSAGTFASGRLDASMGGFSAGVDRSGGYRTHAQRTTARARAHVNLGDRARLVATAFARDFDDPGPLLETQLRVDRRQSDSLFRFDNARDYANTLSVSGERGHLSASVSAELRRTDAFRTIVLAPGFGDIKERVAANQRASGTLRFEQGNWNAGVDASYGTLDSKYYEVANGKRGALDASGSGSRTAAALYAQYSAQSTEEARVFVGARYDWLHDSFEEASASHGAYSSKIGVSVRLDPSTHVYLNAGQSFKAATLDQLFDQRTLPVPFPPFSITTSNAALEPQFGVNYEAGFYHALGHLTTSASVYQMDMKHELDFDVQSLRYVNIGRSRHTGLEFAARYAPRRDAAVFLSKTWQSARARSGANARKQLKAIPRQIFTLGFAVAPGEGEHWEIAALYTENVRMYLDDANTRQIPSYSRADLQVSYRVRHDVRLTLDVRNAFRALYSTTGYADPAGSGAAFFFPAATRSLAVGMRYGW